MKRILSIVSVMVAVAAGAANAHAADITVENAGTVVQNNIRVSAETGGNTAGEARNGTTSVSISVEQSVDGTDLPPVVVSTSSLRSGSLKAHVETGYVNGTSTATVEVVREDAAGKAASASNDAAERESDAAAGASQAQTVQSDDPQSAPVDAPPSTSLLLGISGWFSRLIGRVSTYFVFLFT